MRVDDQTAEILQPWFPALPSWKVRLVHRGPVCWFVRTVLRQGALTFAPYVFFGRHTYDPGSTGSLALLAHELRHVEQYQRYGRVRFLVRYLTDIARNRFRYSPGLPLEAECYALQATVADALRPRHAEGQPGRNSSPAG